jgi:hypothetical protein
LVAIARAVTVTWRVTVTGISIAINHVAIAAQITIARRVAVSATRSLKLAPTSPSAK